MVALGGLVLTAAGRLAGETVIRGQTTPTFRNGSRQTKSGAPDYPGVYLGTAA
jgi:hypothetical protein